MFNPQHRSQFSQKAKTAHPLIKVSLFMFMALLFAFGLGIMKPSQALAQTPEPRHTDPYWQAQYWNNDSLSGEPRLVRQDASINFDWGYGSPDQVINADNFSARWTRYIDVTPGTYRFTIETDDGMRLWVDNEMVIDAWREQAPTVYSGTIYLGPGHHLVKVEYYERNQRAVARVSWALANAPTPTSTPTSTPTTGSWQADYFNNLSLSGPPVVSRRESQINYDWGYGSPAAGVNSNYFSARWSASLNLPSGNYRFNLRVDDGARLFVNGHTLIDAWRTQGATSYSGDIFLPGGPVTVQLEYFEQTEVALVQLSYSMVGSGQPSQPSPTPTATAAPAQWARYSNSTLRVAFDYPASWQRQGNSLLNDRYSGPGGFFQVGAMGATNLDAAASSEAYHVLRPYGSNPTIESLTVAGQPARLILPSADQPSGMQQQAALIVQAPQRIYVGSDYYDFFALYASQPYIRQMAQSLTFLSGAVPPTPTPTYHPPTATPTAPASNAVIVDDKGPGFVKGGNASGWAVAYEGYNGQLTWTQNNAKVQSGYNWARWYPSLRAARYEVSVYIPDRYTTTSSARYWVSHAGGYTLRIVDQSQNGGRWVSLGTYTFRGSDLDYVSLADVTYEPYLSRLVAWDAVKWEPR